MSKKLSLRELPIQGKRVLVRVDFNVPLEKGEILDDTRIKESLPSIQYILEEGGTPILISHLGRPKGEKDPAFSLKPIAKRLEELLGKKVDFYDGPLEFAKPQAGHVLLLENIRFQKGEEKPEKDPSLVEKLKALGDCYVDDAFACCHRAHTSIVPLAKAFPGKAAAGFLLEKEIHYIGDLLAHPKKPFFALIGGSKISTKLGVLKSLLNQVDGLFIGGGMAYTFLRAIGIPIGRSIVEEDLVEEAKHLLAEAKVPIHLPLDFVVTDSIDHPKEIKTVSLEEGIPPHLEGVDIGSQTIAFFGKLLKEAKSVIWNGPFGVYEHPPFDKGTIAIAEILASLKAETIIGGGDSVAAVQRAGLGSKMTHLSTGGGATLEYLEYGTLPGIEALAPELA